MDNPKARIAEQLSGMVAGGYAVDFDLDIGSVPCEECGKRLGAGEDVTAMLSCYEGHTWEPDAFYCRDHGIETIDAAAGRESTDEQTVVAATLEPTGYHDPLGEFHPDAVSLGGLSVLEYSPMRYD